MGAPFHAGLRGPRVRGHLPDGRSLGVRAPAAVAEVASLRHQKRRRCHHLGEYCRRRGGGRGDWGGFVGHGRRSGVEGGSLV